MSGNHKMNRSPVAMPAHYGYDILTEYENGQEDSGDSLSRQVHAKPIEGFEELYSITRNGNVISHGGKQNHNEPIVLSCGYDKDGYRRVTLQKNNKRSYFRVARLVAKAFVPNPANYPIVNHIDERKDNDCVENLEWTDSYGNWKHSEESMPSPETSVIKLSLSGDYICEYKSLMDAARDTGINQGNITNCLKGRCKTVGGYRWILK